MFALATSPVRAADIEVRTAGLVWVRVDGKPAHRALGRSSTWVLGLSDGTHAVEVRSLFGKSLSTLPVRVRGEERVLLRYEHHQVVELGRGNSIAVQRAADAVTEAATTAASAAATAAQVEAQAARAQAQAAEAHIAAAKAAAAAHEIQSRLLAPGLGEQATAETLQQRRPRAGGAAPMTGLSAGTGGEAQASASITGLDPSLFSVTLDGKPLAWVAAMGAFVATDLAPGTVPFVLYLDGKPAMSADFNLPEAQHTACTILARADGYDAACVAGAAPLTAIDLLQGRTAQPLPDPAGPVVVEPLLQALIRSIDDEAYSKARLRVIRDAAKRHLFTCAQVARILDTLPYNADKVEAVHILRPAIVDPDNEVQLEEALQFNSDKQAVRSLFAQDPADPR